MQSYYSIGASPATQWSYLTSLKQYTTFYSQAKLLTTPTFEATLLLFVTHLATLNFSYSTIKVYLAAVYIAHVAAGKQQFWKPANTTPASSHERNP